jgi:acetyl esterase/lipase
MSNEVRAWYGHCTYAELMLRRLPLLALISMTSLPGVGCIDVEEVHDVAYDDSVSRDRMDVYLPNDGRTERPAVMLIHGGSWTSGSKDIYRHVGPRLAGAGFVTVAINYRLTPDGAYPRLMQDAICALSFLRGHADDWGLDPDRVALVGYSAGGHMASLLGVNIDEPDFQPDCAAGPTYPPAAVVSGAGPQDLSAIASADVVKELIGGSLADYPERYERASPPRHVTAAAPPFLFVHGSDDWILPIEHSYWMRDALVAAGVDARLLELNGGGHLLNPGADLGQVDILTSADAPEAWAALIQFLDDTLGAP